MYISQQALYSTLWQTGEKKAGQCCLSHETPLRALLVREFEWITLELLTISDDKYVFPLAGLEAKAKTLPQHFGLMSLYGVSWTSFNEDSVE